MRCRRARRMLPLLVGGEIRGRRAEILDLHVRRCERCRERLASYEAARQSLFRLKGARSGPGPDLWPEIRRRIDGAPTPVGRHTRGLAMATAAFAAVLVAAVAITDFDVPRAPAATVVEEAEAPGPVFAAPDPAPVSPGNAQYPLQQVGLAAGAGSERYDAFPSVHSAAPERASWDEF